MDLSKIGRLLFPSKQSENPKLKYSQTPDPAEMFKSGLPEKHFQGRKVAWDLIVRNMHGEISRNEVLVLTTYGIQPGNIWLTIDAEKYPGIYYCAPGSRVTVKGEVSAVKGEDIYLTNCEINQ